MMNWAQMILEYEAQRDMEQRNEQVRTVRNAGMLVVVKSWQDGDRWLAEAMDCRGKTMGIARDRKAAEKDATMKLLSLRGQEAEWKSLEF